MKTKHTLQRNQKLNKKLKVIWGSPLLKVVKALPSEEKSQSSVKKENKIFKEVLRAVK